MCLSTYPVPFSLGEQDMEFCPQWQQTSEAAYRKGEIPANTVR